MSTILELASKINRLVQDNEALLAKGKEVKYHLKVAEAQGNEQQVKALNAEVSVLTEMMKDNNEELKKLGSEHSALVAVFKAKEKEFDRNKNFAVVAAFLCFFMPGFAVGALYFIGCIGLAFYFQRQAQNNKSYAAGLTDADLTRIRKAVHWGK